MVEAAFYASLHSLPSSIRRHNHHKDSILYKRMISLRAYPQSYVLSYHYSYSYPFLPTMAVKICFLGFTKSRNNLILDRLPSLKTTVSPSLSGGLNAYSTRKPCLKRFRVNAELELASAIDVINDLGFDTLTFLAVTVMVVPAFRIIKASPILGFFCAGVVLNQFGLIRNLTDVKVLSEWGILFLLFEMGLELSLASLKALAKFAFGMGLTQVVLSTLAFTAFELPPNGAIGTRILEFLFHSRPDL